MATETAQIRLNPRRINVLCIEQGKSQTEFAQMIGKHLTWVNGLIRNRFTIKDEGAMTRFVERLAKYLDVDVDEILL